MGLDDIDEDEAPRPIGGARVAKPVDMDDIFGDAGRSVAQPQTSAPLIVQNVVSPMPQAKRDFLDDVFESPSHSSTTSPQPEHESLMNFKRPVVHKKHQRTEQDLLDELMTGKKATTTSTSLKDIANHQGSQAQYNPHLLQLMTYYDMLGVSSTAVDEEIHRAYKKKAIEMHPDRQHSRSEGQSVEEGQVYKLITTAHEILMDPIKRAEYDRQQKLASTQENWLRHI
jgi:DnaJ-domain-containing protein 1